MSYRIEAGESVGAGVRRTCQRQIALALKASRTPRQGDHSPVHETRKHLKKARSALRLIAPAVGRKEFQATDRKLKKVGKLLSEMRDAEVRFQTVRQLIETFNLEKDRVLDDTETYLGFELESVLAAFADWEKEVETRLKRVRRRVANWPAKKLNCGQLRGTVERSYQRGVKSLQKAIGYPTADNFHTFRKAVKELTCQLRVLAPLHPSLFGQQVDELNVAAKNLGNAHDLAFLVAHLRKLGSEGDENTRRAHALFELIGLREKELQLRAAALGEKFCAERPKDFSQRILGYLQAWKAANSGQVAAADRVLRLGIAPNARQHHMNVAPRQEL